MEPQLYHQSRPSADGNFAAVGARYGCSAPLPGRMTEQRQIKGAFQGRLNFQISTRDVYSFTQFLADTFFIVLLAIATGIAYREISHGGTGPIFDFAFTGLTVALLFAAIGRLMAGQRVATLTTSFDRVRDAAQAWTVAFAALVFVLFALKAGSQFSRGAMFSFYLLGVPLVALWRVFTPVAITPLAKKAERSRDCIVLGDSADPFLEKFVSELQANGHPAPKVLTFQAACIVDLWKQELKSLVLRVTEAAHDLSPGEIYVCAGSISSDRLTAIGRVLSIIPRAIYVVPDAQTASLVRCKPASVGAHIALEVRREPMKRLQRVVKRILDLTIAGTAAITLLPLFAIVALAIKLDSPGPVFFRQTRNGYRGRPFKIFKFRSMCVLQDGADAARQASRSDPRITRMGRVLRKSSIDELPQLLNVLRGEMSLVGPRPHPIALDEIYSRMLENYAVRQHVKPGLTGWAQVNGLRGETATIDLMNRRIEFDLWYAVNASILLDVEILVRTAIEVCRQRNAY